MNPRTARILLGAAVALYLLWSRPGSLASYRQWSADVSHGDSSGRTAPRPPKPGPSRLAAWFTEAR